MKLNKNSNNNKNTKNNRDTVIAIENCGVINLMNQPQPVLELTRCCSLNSVCVYKLIVEQTKNRKVLFVIRKTVFSRCMGVYVQTSMKLETTFAHAAF